MNYFNQKFDDIERRAKEIAENKAKVIFEILDSKFNIANSRFLAGANTYLSKLLNIMVYYPNNEAVSLCKYLLKQNGANFEFFLTSFAKPIFMPETPTEYSTMLAYVINKLNIYEFFSCCNHNVDVLTSKGKLYMMSAYEWLRKNHGYEINTQHFFGHCHQVTFDLARLFPDYYATTVLIPSCFEGKSFHSFFSTPDDKFVLDLSIGDVVKKGDYYSVMGCEEILGNLLCMLKICMQIYVAVKMFLKIWLLF